MRIKFLLTQSLESPSGLGRYAPMAKELSRLGHQVNVIALHPQFEALTARNLSQDGYTVIYAAPMHVRKIGNRKFYYSNSQLIYRMSVATLSISRASFRAKSDVVHICKPHPMNSLAGLLTRIRSGEPLCLDCDDYETASGRFSATWQSKIIRLFETRLPGRVSTITTNTYFMRDQLIAWGVPPDKITYIANGVDRERFGQLPESRLAELRAELGLSGKKVIVFVGSLSRPGHPVDLLLDAFAKVHRSEPDSVLLLVGGGEDYDSLKAEAGRLGVASAVQFCGRVDPNLAPAYYALASVSVDPVLADDAARGRAPLKLFESWACGVPFVSADVGDRKRLLGEPPAGLLAEPGDAESLSRAILVILQNPEYAQQMVEIGKQRIRNYYWDELVHKLEGVYRSIIHTEGN